MYIYQLIHELSGSEFTPKGNRIGYFSGYESAKAAREKYIEKNAVDIRPESFRTIRHIIGSDDCQTIFAVDTVADTDGCSAELGVFATKDAAERYIDFFIRINGTGDTGGKSPQIKEYRLDDYDGTSATVLVTY